MRIHCYLCSSALCLNLTDVPIWKLIYWIWIEPNCDLILRTPLFLEVKVREHLFPFVLYRDSKSFSGQGIPYLFQSCPLSFRESVRQLKKYPLLIVYLLSFSPGTLRTSLRLSDVFHGCDNSASASPLHQLVGVVTYYGKHYSTFFFHTKLKVWIYFDDATVREVGPRWEQVSF